MIKVDDGLFKEEQGLGDVLSRFSTSFWGSLRSFDLRPRADRLRLGRINTEVLYWSFIAMKHALCLGITVSLPSIGKSNDGKLHICKHGSTRIYMCRSSWYSA
jgi:hypothetical protein